MEKELNINGEPKVTVLWSEHNVFYENQELTISIADDFFKLLNETVNEDLMYYKTKFRIDFVMGGEKGSYEGRYDAGSEKGGLIEHIKQDAKFDLDNSSYLITNSGNDVYNEIKEKAEFIIEEFVPYLYCHKSLRELEKKYEKYIDLKIDYTSKEKDYLKSLKGYIDETRVSLNKGFYDKLDKKQPEPPLTFPTSKEAIAQRKLVKSQAKSLLEKEEDKGQVEEKER